MQRTLDILTRLIAFDTTSDRSNLALIHFVRDLLAEHDIQATVLPNAEGDKASLLATIGPPVAGGVVLSGHTDTVPVTGQTWSQDPYQATLKEGRLYGRGSVDMKGFIALCLAMVPQFLASPLKRPIHL
ncbi:M20/M25/M40 family metallo-hydrolase, partial [uncultured Cobetia sp.]